MKSVKTLAILLITAFSLTLGSCKKEKEAKETEPVEMNTDTITPESDTVQAAPVNDTNVAGTTSGKMEQVP